MCRIAFLVLAFAVVALAFAPPTPRRSAASPSAEALAALDAVVKGYVDRDETIAAELMVIAGGDVVLHTAYGFADREAKRALEPNAIFCVRSMTKPLVGTAAQILIDEGALGIDDPVSKWLPQFGRDEHAAITVRHLLEHTSGLPLSSLIAHPPGGLRSIDEVADFAANEPLQSKPGEGFAYSDDGADTLTAIVGKASGGSPEAFIAARILEPLGMHDTHCTLPSDRSRFVSAYAGSAGGWTKFWSRDDAPLFGCFLGSQGLYTTCADYAKLIRLWANDGVAPDGRRLLSHAAVERGLAPLHETGFPCAMSGVDCRYGQLWTVWTKAAGDHRELVAFGHGGSDGTIAWYWPDRDLMVLYFTQARGGLSVVSLERDVDRLLVAKSGAATPAAAPAIDPRRLVGLYWDPNRERYVAVDARDDRLVIEMPGLFAGAMKVADDGRFTFELDPRASLRAELDGSGAVTALVLDAAGHVERWPRLVRDGTLPTTDAVVDKLVAAHGIGRDGIPFPILRHGTSDAPALRRHVAVTQRFDGVRMNVSSVPSDGQGPEQRSVSDGEHVWSKQGDKPAQEVTGILREQSLLEHPGRAFGDWRAWYRAVEVVARVQVDGAPHLIVRCVAELQPSTCMIVDEGSGRVVGMERIATIPGLGAVGASIRLGDFRAISRGERTITLPFHAVLTFANPVLGTSDSKLESVETPERFDASLFAAP
ncbi:MAG: serine hydrolase domain-containing protein [Phycisphaerales bacterium]